MKKRSSQHGAATLAVAALLAAAMLLAALYVNRHLLAEQRSAARQVQSTQAFEAAEAGIEWALAQLNAPRRIGTDCQASAASPVSFRERHLAWQPRSGVFEAGTQQPACVRNASGWTCHCPAEGAGTPAVDDDGVPHPGFSVAFSSGDRPGTVRIRSQGCMPFAKPCAAGAENRADANARVEVLVALMPGIARAPAAALTARGIVVANGALAVHNADPRSGGLALHTGGAVQAPLLRLTAPAGSPNADAFLVLDPALSAATPQAVFASTFGTARTTWREQPAAHRLSCGGECGAALQAAIGDGIVQPLVAVDGDLRVDGPLTLGTPERPVVIVVEGDVRFAGAVTLHGLLYARNLRWDDTTGPGALLRGAVVLEEGYAGNGAPDIARDHAILERLRGERGSFVRLPGGWRDF